MAAAANRGGRGGANMPPAGRGRGRGLYIVFITIIPLQDNITGRER